MLNSMEIVATIYLGLAIISKIWEVFSFGEERKPYSPTLWLTGLILNAPLYWILAYVAFF